MTDPPPHADRLTRHQYRETFGQYTDKAMQEHAEREGHVPPGVGPVSVAWFGERSRNVVWEWVTGEDSTGRLKQLWFTDGPWAGQARMIEADIPADTIVAFPNFTSVHELQDDGTLSPAAYRYRIEQRADGLWFGRWVA